MKIRYVILTAISAFALNHSANAQNTLAVGEPTGTLRYDTYPGAGFEFFAPATVGSTTINALGFWDQGGDGLLSDHTVSLFQYAGTLSAYNLLATVTVSAGTVDPLIGGYRWASITPITLPDNGQNGGYYAILASENLDAWSSGIGNPTTVDSTIGTYMSFALVPGDHNINGNTDPIDGDQNQAPGADANGYGGANLGFIAPVPEPTTCALLGGGMMVLMALRRKM
jgi:hypothetical protein